MEMPTRLLNVNALALTITGDTHHNFMLNGGTSAALLEGSFHADQSWYNIPLSYSRIRIYVQVCDVFSALYIPKDRQVAENKKEIAVSLLFRWKT